LPPEADSAFARQTTPSNAVASADRGFGSRGYLSAGVRGRPRRRPQALAFQPRSHPALPAVNESARARTPVDRFLLAKLEAAKLSFAPEADRTTFIRRTYLDLIGLPPTPNVVADFEADKSTDAFEKLIDRLLASPHFGERWGFAKPYAWLPSLAPPGLYGP
jgi:hypothetical protein